MAETTIAPGTRLEFANGWAIDIDDIWRGQVCYRRWPPGVEIQGMFDRTYRMPIADFERLLQAEREKEARAGRMLDGQVHDGRPG